MPPDAISLNKAAIIERCLRRLREEYESDSTLASPTHLEALTLNLERACQAAIDLAMHIVATEHLGVPQSSAESFTLLHQAGKLDPALAARLAGMTGFRNIAIHPYRDLDAQVIHYIMQEGGKDLQNFCAALNLNIALSTGQKNDLPGRANRLHYPLGDRL